MCWKVSVPVNMKQSLLEENLHRLDLIICVIKLAANVVCQQRLNQIYLSIL